MKKIFQYRLWPDIDQELQLPVGALILDVNQSCGDLYLWALCDECHESTDPRKIRIVETGKPVSDDVQRWTYISTYTDQAFGKVFHVFEERPLDSFKSEAPINSEGKVRWPMAGEILLRK